MKKQTLFIWSLILFVGSLSAQKFESPLEYMEFIGNQLDLIEGRNIDYVTFCVHSENYGKMEKKRRAVVQQINKSYRVIKGMPGYEGNERLRSEATKVLELYKETFTRDFNEAALLKKTSKESFAAMERYFKAEDRANLKLSKASDRFSLAQEKFAEKNNINLVKEEGKNTLAIVGEVNRYKRSLFLTYFKMSKPLTFFWDAFSKENPALMERHHSSLLEALDEADQKAIEIGAFNDDDSYLLAVKNVLEAARLQHSEQQAEMIKIIRNKKKMNQRDVDFLNNAIDDYNNDYIQIVNKMNEIADQFSKNHIPKNPEAENVFRS